MKNTIENAKEFLTKWRDERTHPVSTDYFAELIVAYAASVRPEVVLPSEKEMYKAAENFYEDNDDKPYGRVTAFLEGAKWMQKRLNPGTNFVESK